jgi:hypothetical protein
MITPKDMDRFNNNQIVAMYQKLNEQLSKTIISKLNQAGDISSFTKAQIRQLELQGGHDIFTEALAKTNSLTAKRKRELVKLYNDIGATEMKGYSSVFKLKGLDYKLSAENIQLLNAALRRANRNLRNFTGSIAYASRSTFIDAVDELYKEVVTGSYDYDSAMRRTSTELAEQNIKLKTKDGRKEKIEVAVRRNLMTSIHQTAQDIAKNIGEQIRC